MRLSQILLWVSVLIILYFLGSLVSVLSFKIAMILITGLVFSGLTLLNLEIGLFLFIFVVPFTQQISLGKLASFPVKFGTDDILILFILLSWLLVMARRKEPLIHETSLNWPLAAFFTVSVLSFIGAYTRFGPSVVAVGTLHLFKFFEYTGVYFIVVAAIKDYRQIRKFIFMFFCITGIIAASQIVAMIRWGSLSLNAATPNYDLVYSVIKSMYSFDSNAILGAYYCFFLSILVAIILNTPLFQKKLPLVLFAGLISFVLFNTFSRSAYVGIIVSFIIMAILRERKLFLIILVLVLLSPAYLQSAVLERISLTVQNFHPRLMFDPSAAIRLTIWKRAIPIISNNLFLGYGYWSTQTILKSEAHSQYFAVIIETGLVGFFVFCWLIVRMFKNSVMLRQRADPGFLKSLGLGYIAGLAAVLATCFFSETLEAFRMVGPLWFVTGLVTSANRLLSLSQKKSEKIGMDGT